jgi:hypothetical protein
MYYRGFYDLQTYQALLSCCPFEGDKKGGEQKPCDFSQYVTIDAQGNSHPKYTNSDTWNTCADLINKWGFEMVWTSL